MKIISNRQSHAFIFDEFGNSIYCQRQCLSVKKYYITFFVYFYSFTLLVVHSYQVLNVPNGKRNLQFRLFALIIEGDNHFN